MNTLAAESGVSVVERVDGVIVVDDVVVIGVVVVVLEAVVVVVAVLKIFDLDDLSTLKLVTKWDIEVGLSVLVLKRIAS